MNSLEIIFSLLTKIFWSYLKSRVLLISMFDSGTWNNCIWFFASFVLYRSFHLHIQVHHLLFLSLSPNTFTYLWTCTQTQTDDNFLKASIQSAHIWIIKGQSYNLKEKNNFWNLLWIKYQPYIQIDGFAVLFVCLFICLVWMRLICFS